MRRTSRRIRFPCDAEILTVIAVHLLGRPLGQLIDHDNPAEEEEGLRPYELHIICKPKSEPRIRALLVQDTAKSEVVLTGIDTTRTDDGTETHLTARLLAGDDAAQRLEELVARVSLEPGIRGVHWHSTDEPSPAPPLAVPEEEPGSPDESVAG
jgi:putative Mg2+ transporter-C (MgtC) family protein